MLNQYLNKQWLDSIELNKIYRTNKPYPHIVMENFFHEDKIEKVLKEFPDLSKKPKDKISHFNNLIENKFASKNIDVLSPSAFNLISFLNSEFFLKYLQNLTGIKELLISDPYLSGGGYHEIKRGGVLKIHADFNMHPHINLDRRLNLLIYLNKNWDEKWGGDFQIFDRNMNGPLKKVYPHFNTCVIFNTASHTFHGHPDPLMCPKNKSRKSIALYYFSSGRPRSESNKIHSTIFRERENERFDTISKVQIKIKTHIKNLLSNLLR
jgi:Rps23 Pro-64 3,4-dihydroxylase Tpa1-like proline 4-hydroxylase